MKRLLVTCLTVAMLVAIAPAARGDTVVTFDNLTGTFGSMPTGYGGINWGSAWYYAAYSPTNPSYTAYSPPNYATNYSLMPTFSFSTPVVFEGAYFSGGLAGNRPISVQFTLYLGNLPVATSGSLSLSSVSTWLASGYSGNVDEVQIATSWSYGQLGGYVWAMDNLTYVPLPAAILLLASGLAGLAAARKRPKKNSRTASQE